MTNPLRCHHRVLSQDRAHAIGFVVYVALILQFVLFVHAVLDRTADTEQYPETAAWEDAIFAVVVLAPLALAAAALGLIRSRPWSPRVFQSSVAVFLSACLVVLVRELGTGGAAGRGDASLGDTTALLLTAFWGTCAVIALTVLRGSTITAAKVHRPEYRPLVMGLLYSAALSLLLGVRSTLVTVLLFLIASAACYGVFEGLWRLRGLFSGRAAVPSDERPEAHDPSAGGTKKEERHED